MTTQTPASCPFHGSTPPAPPAHDIPDRIAKLPKKGGWHVPFFVDKVGDDWDFRVMDGAKLVEAVKKRLCWICGEKMGKKMSFVLGPMCGITRTNGEPPSHRGCAEYAAKNCPFLTRPRMKRREDEITDAGFTAGIGLTRNPGCCAVWTTTSYKPFKPPGGGVLFTIGEPLEVDWYAEGRPATRAEVLASVESGIPILRESCDKEEERYRREAHHQLDEAVQRFMQLLPKPAVEFLDPSTREPQPDLSKTGVLVINDRDNGLVESYEESEYTEGGAE